MIARATLAVVLLAMAHIDSPRRADSVSLQVCVIDATGAAIAGLKQEDFRITLDGRAHAIDYFSADPGAVSAVLLLDASASLDLILGPGALQKSIEEWIGSSGPGDDRWQVGSFARELYLSGGFTQERNRLLAHARQSLGMPESERFGPSPLWDAVDEAITALETADGRRAVIVVTDGRTTGNRRGVQEVMRHALAAGVPISIIGTAADQSFPLGKDSVLLVQPQVAVELIAKVTGGAYLAALPPAAVSRTAPDSRNAGRLPQPMPGNALGTQLDRILDELRRSYLLGFSMTADQRRAQNLEVVVSRPGVTVRSPKYVVAAGSR